jgi:hypothetical protein
MHNLPPVYISLTLLVIDVVLPWFLLYTEPLSQLETY